MRPITEIAREMLFSGENTDSYVLDFLRTNVLSVRFKLRNAETPTVERARFLERMCFYLIQVGDVEFDTLVKKNMTKIRQVYDPDVRHEIILAFQENAQTHRTSAESFYYANYTMPFTEICNALNVMKDSLEQRLGCELNWENSFDTVGFNVRQRFLELYKSEFWFK